MPNFLLILKYKKIGGKKARPQFDHFYPKSKYPYLALSFYNLVPSCAVCNLAKSDNLRICREGINPYSDGFPNDCRFTIDTIEKCVLVGNSKEWKISLPPKGKHQHHVDTLLLGDLYSQHKDYVEEIVFKAQAYNDDCYAGLLDSFSGLGLTPNEMNRLIFGNYIAPAEYGKRPLSKLTADILHQLGIPL